MHEVSVCACDEEKRDAGVQRGQEASHVPESRGGSGEHADGEREQGGAESEGAIAGGVFEGVR